METLPRIGGDGQGVLRCYSEVDAGPVMSLERERGGAGHHRPADAFSAAAGCDDNAREAAREMRPNHADLNMPHGLARWCQRGEDCSDVWLRRTVPVSLELVFCERIAKGR